MPTYITQNKMKNLIEDKFKFGVLNTQSVATSSSKNIPEQQFENYFSFENWNWNEDIDGQFECEDYDFYSVIYQGTTADRHGTYYHYSATFIKNKSDIYFG